MPVSDLTLFLEAIPRLHAQEQIEMINAVRLGVADGRRPAVREATARLTRRASGGGRRTATSEQMRDFARGLAATR